MSITVITPLELNKLTRLRLDIDEEENNNNYDIMNDVIIQTQEEIADRLGVKFGNKMLTEYLNNTQEVFIRELFKGAVYDNENNTFKGLDYVIAHLASFYYIDRNELNYTTMGVQVANAQNSTKVNPSRLLNKLYNTASSELEKAIDYIDFWEKENVKYDYDYSEVKKLSWRSDFNF